MINLGNCLRLANGSVELTITLDFGPRILAYRYLDGSNVLMVFEDAAETAHAGEWAIRGGHRLWCSPESESTYFPDNQPVKVISQSDHHALVEPEPEVENGLQKTLEVQLASEGTEVTVRHRLTALRDLQERIGAWGISVMKPGGSALVPQPPIRLHPNDRPGEPANTADLLPNRQLALWPYTDPADPRFSWLPDLFQVTQQTGMPSTKVGFQHEAGSVSYLVDGYRFTKTVPFEPEATYPDRGCNLEIFTNTEILELETLGPLHRLKAGESIEHIETWTLERA